MAVVVPEIFANKAASALNGGINTSVTSLEVDDGSLFPSVGRFRVLIDDEIMICTARSGNTLTVIRGQEATAADSHADDAPVTHVLTAGSFYQYLADNVQAGPIDDRQAADRAGRIWIPDSGLQFTRDDGASWIGFGPLHKFKQTPLVSGFTWDNQGSSMAVDTGGTIVLDALNGTDPNWRILYKTAPATPYSITAAFRPWGYGTNPQRFGLIFRESSSGKLATCHVIQNASASLTLVGVGKLVTASSTPTDYLAATNMHMAWDVVWLRITDDGTNRISYISPDGMNWMQLHSVSRTDHLTANQVGFGCNNGGSNNVKAFCRLLSWEET